MLQPFRLLTATTLPDKLHAHTRMQQIILAQCGCSLHKVQYDMRSSACANVKQHDTSCYALCTERQFLCTNKALEQHHSTA